MKNIIVFIFLLKLISSNNIFCQHKLEDFFKNKKKESVAVESEIEKKTKKCNKYSGLFNFYQRKKMVIHILRLTLHIGKEFIHFCYIENGVSDIMKGSYRGSKIIKINKYYDKIEFTIENTKFYFDPENPLEKGSKTNINTPIVVSEKIIATNNENTSFLINADNIFLNESLQQIKYTFNRSGVSN